MLQISPSDFVRNRFKVEPQKWGGCLYGDGSHKQFVLTVGDDKQSQFLLTD